MELSILSIARAIAGLLLALFIPGYSLTLLMYPKRKDIGAVDRIALSSVLSIAIVVLTALFIDIVLGIDYSAYNMTAALLVFTAACALAWLAKTRGKY